MGVVVLAALATACGKGDDDDHSTACSKPVIDGSTFAFVGTATVHGTGTLPSGVPDGEELDFSINTDTEGDLILPPNTVTLLPHTCGPTFDYTVRDLAAGTYHLYVELYGADQNHPDAMGPSTEAFSVTDGQNLEFDPKF